MKPLTINVQISKCPKQYESVRLGGEWTVEEGETVEQAMSKALEMLNQFYVESQKPKEQKAAAPKKEEAKADPTPAAEKPAKQRLSFEKDSKTLQAVCKRLEAGVKLGKVLEYYEPDEQAMRALELAAKLNEK